MSRIFKLLREMKRHKERFQHMIIKVIRVTKRLIRSVKHEMRPIYYINGSPVNQNSVVLGSPRSQTYLEIMRAFAPKLPDVSNISEEDARTELSTAGFNSIITDE